MTSASFAISAGWTWTGPSESQRVGAAARVPEADDAREEQQPDDRRGPGT